VIQSTSFVPGAFDMGQGRRDERCRPLWKRFLSQSEQVPSHSMMFSLTVLCCVGLLFLSGCRKGPTEFTETEADAQKDELLKRFQAPPADTPEQIQEKQAKVTEGLPKVRELLEQAKTDPKKTDEAVELSMSLVALVPNHREAMVTYCKAQMASFYAKEALNAEGIMADEHNMAIAIRSAGSQIDRLRKEFKDLSEDEVKLCHDAYFHRARLEAFYPDGSDSESIFREAIDKLISTGFRDAERLRTEPRFEKVLNNPKFGPAIKAAIEQIEGATKSAAEPQASEDKTPAKPE